MSASTSLKIYSFLLFLLFITSMGCWIGWGHKTTLQSVLGVLLILTAFLGKLSFDFSRKNVILCAVFYMAYITVSLGFGMRVLFTQLASNLIPVICIVCLRDEYKATALAYITKFYAWLIIPSFLFYLLCFIEVPFSFGRITPSEDSITGGYHNLLLYVRPLNIHGDIHRFNGPFMEAGHLGMMGAFLLMANAFDLKKRVCKIILASIVLSLSLAGYILSLIGFLMCRYYEGKLKLPNLVLYSALFSVLVIGGQAYNGGENLLNEKILQRLESDEEKGFSGNNRTNLYVMELYSNMLNDTDLFLWGYSQKEQEAMEEYFGHSTGFQYYMVRHGFVLTLFAFSFYLLGLYFARDKKYATLFLLFVVLCFLQRTYPFWLAWVLCYIYGITIRDENSLLIEDYQ